jgi:hypothetical protein
VQTVFGTDERMFSADIVAALIDDPEWEWSDLGRGKSLTQAGLAKQLKLYGIRSQNVRIGEGQAKGYTADGEDGLAQAWDRYLPSTCSRPKRPKGVPPETPSEQPLFDNGTAGTAGTHTDGSAERNGQTPSGFQAPSGPGRCDECGWHIETHSARRRSVWPHLADRRRLSGYGVHPFCAGIGGSAIVKSESWRSERMSDKLSRRGIDVNKIKITLSTQP